MVFPINWDCDRPVFVLFCNIEFDADRVAVIYIVTETNGTEEDFLVLLAFACKVSEDFTSNACRQFVTDTERNISRSIQVVACLFIIITEIVCLFSGE
ncbi:MAG: hypothetical protein IKO39_10705 [Treponema sp.]|nr:hypothetical protein [Treponema sp.]